MEIDPKTPNAETLRQMPYSELKKIAKQRGIKGNLKAEKIIAALVSMDSDDTDSFSTPAAKIVNSSKKKKVEKFDEDSKTPLVTPRRGTYSIGSPIDLKKDLSPSSTVNESIKLDESINLDVYKVIDDSTNLDMSNVTVGRGSERKLRNRKVSFLSPVMTPHTPRNSNLKMRPKTPIVSRTPHTEDISYTPLKELSIDLRKPVDVSLHLTSFSEKISDEPDSTSIVESTSLISTNEVSPKKKSKTTPKSVSLLVDSEVSAKKKTRIITPKPTRTSLGRCELSKKKRVATPNFKKIHQKAFEKMESIDDYQKRVLNSAKKTSGLDFKAKKGTKESSKIPAFGGIPFIPSVSKSYASKPALLNNKKKEILNRSNLDKNENKKKDAENMNLRSKSKFDLKASLSRKLGYKPYTGPLKPLTPSTILNTSTAVCTHKAKEPEIKEPANKVVTSNRLKNRSMLRGVRTNKRFELQMKNRNLQ